MIAISELIIKIKSPYKITLFIDKKKCLKNNEGIYIENIDFATEHVLEILIKKETFNTKKFKTFSNFFKLKDRYCDEFTDLFYKVSFVPIKTHSNATLSIDYRKKTVINPDKKM